MDKDKQINELQRRLWWREMQFRAREVYLLRRIEHLEEEIARLKTIFR